MKRLVGGVRVQRAATCGLKNILSNQYSFFHNEDRTSLFGEIDLCRLQQERGVGIGVGMVHLAMP
jgi:hypothetical protein